jgi:thioredoxin reductase (NADPH)
LDFAFRNRAWDERITLLPAQLENQTCEESSSRMRPLKNTCQVAVIGGGIAGLAAARHAARLGALVTLFEGSGLFGGLVATVGEVDFLPVPGKFSGQDLAIALLADARLSAVQVIESHVAAIDPGPRLSLIDQEDKVYYPEAVIIASGASLRHLGISREADFNGRGVSRCATCDGGFFRGQDVVVVGGGDAASHEALVLAKTSRRVIMVCRSKLKAKREYIEKLAARENVSFIWDSEISEILGEDGVCGVRLRNVNNGATWDIECAGLFPFIGVAPNSCFAPESLRATDGCIQTGPHFATSDRRLFAVGAVRLDFGGNLVQAMAEGVGAAEAAARLHSN